MSFYEIIFLGAPLNDFAEGVKTRALDAIKDFGFIGSNDLSFRDAADFAGRDLKAASVAVYFGNKSKIDESAAKALLAAGVPIIPVINTSSKFEDEIPDILMRANGIKADLPHDFEMLSSAILECIGLLRVQRRVFVSYRRDEARTVALQLHDRLNQKGFDVFLDTHDIRPGEPFQDVLWHRLCDCDVVVMIDSPTYFEKKWTREEFGRALAKEIHIVRVVMPDHVPAVQLSVGDMTILKRTDLTGDGELVDPVMQRIAQRVEITRSRSLAARHRSIVGKLRAEIQAIGGTVDAVGAHRSVALTLANGKTVIAYPAVGVPSAELLNDISAKSIKAGHKSTPVLVYDHVGLRAPWLEHLEWLNDNITVVRSLKVNEAAWHLGKIGL